MSEPRLVPVLFFGHLRKKFGKGHSFRVSTPAEGVRACCCTIDGFREYVGKTHANSGFRVLVGGEAVDVDHLNDLSGGQEIRIVPVVRGAKEGLGQVIFGAVLIIVGAIGTYTPWGQAFGGATWGPYMMKLGAGMALGGVAQLLASPPNPLAYGADDSTRPGSYLFGGADQAMQAGGSVPVLYGKLEIPLTLISGGIVPEASGVTHFGMLGDGDGNWSGDGITVPLAASIRATP